MGLSKGAIDRAVHAARLHRVFRGVYALGYPSSDARARWMASTLACGQGACISHRTAATMLGLLDRGPASIDLIAPGSRGRKIDGVRAHKVGPLCQDEIGTVDDVPCTSPARTFVDLAGTVGGQTLRSCFERAAARRMLDLDAIEASMRPGRRGMPTLRALVAEWRPAVPVAAAQRLKSPLEAKVLPLLIGRGLPTPQSNAPVALAGGRRIEVDFLWAKQCFVVEADSRSFHSTDVAFERDRWRDRELTRVGYSVLRVTHREAKEEPEAVFAAIRRALQEG